MFICLSVSWMTALLWLYNRITFCSTLTGLIVQLNPGITPSPLLLLPLVLANASSKGQKQRAQMLVVSLHLPLQSDVVRTWSVGLFAKSDYYTFLVNYKNIWIYENTMWLREDSSLPTVHKALIGWKKCSSSRLRFHWLSWFLWLYPLSQYRTRDMGPFSVLRRISS